MQLRKKRTKDGDWIVANDATGTHAHFFTKKGCNSIITFIRKDIEPTDPYFIEAKRRLTEPNKEEKKEYKDRYYNVQKGVR